MPVGVGFIPARIGENKKMTEHKKLQPEIRFAGFTDDWEQRKLGTCGNIITGNTPSTKNKLNYTDNGLLWVTPTDIKSNITTKTANTLSEEGKKLARTLPKNSILVTCIASIGKNTLILEEASCNQQINALIPNNNHDPYFLLTYSFIWSEKMKLIAGAGTMDIVNKTQFSDILCAFPSLEEQTQIGNFFKQLDDTIALHQRTLEKYQKLKISYLEKMFPKENELYPELRFPNFTDAWEQRKLGELGYTFNGLNGKSKDDFGHGSAKYITYMNVYKNPIATLEELDLIEIDKSQNEIKKGDILFTTSSETPEEVGLSSVWMYEITNIYVNSFCFGFRLEQKISINYMAYMLRSNSIRNKITLLAQGISRYNISKKGMMNIEVFLPSYAEQTQIGNFFKQLDDTIALHQREVKKYKKIKQSYLEKMFI